MRITPQHLCLEQTGDAAYAQVGSQAQVRTRIGVKDPDVATVDELIEESGFAAPAGVAIAVEYLRADGKDVAITE